MCFKIFNWHLIVITRYITPTFFTAVLWKLTLKKKSQNSFQILNAIEILHHEKVLKIIFFKISIPK